MLWGWPCKQIHPSYAQGNPGGSVGLGASGGTLETQRMSHPAKGRNPTWLSPLSSHSGVRRARPTAGALQDGLAGRRWVGPSPTFSLCSWPGPGHRWQKEEVPL